VTVASDHLWRHFTPAGASPIVIERGEGCHIWDTDGNRYLDALAALYCVNIGYGPYPEIAEAAREQLEKLPFFTNWVGFATPPALELTEKLSELVPIDVGRIFLVSGGSEVTKEESWGRRKLAYSINKVNEGKYVLLYVSSENGKTALPEVEHRMRQNDRILRYLTVRTDEDLKRAARRQPAKDAAPGADRGERAGEDGEPEEEA